MIEKMKCEHCKEISPINGFGGYLHYTDTKKIIDALVQRELWEETHSNSFEIYYRCKVCNTIWVLAEPDFPVVGYFMQK